MPLLLANGEEAAKTLGASQANNESPGAISFVSQTIVDIGWGPVRFTTTMVNEEGRKRGQVPCRPKHETKNEKKKGDGKDTTI